MPEKTDIPSQYDLAVHCCLASSSTLHFTTQPSHVSQAFTSAGALRDIETTILMPDVVCVMSECLMAICPWMLSKPHDACLCHTSGHDP